MQCFAYPVPEASRRRSIKDYHPEHHRVVILVKFLTLLFHYQIPLLQDRLSQERIGNDFRHSLRTYPFFDLTSS
jgi:hypothetical protein